MSSPVSRGFRQLRRPSAAVPGFPSISEVWLRLLEAYRDVDGGVMAGRN